MSSKNQSAFLRPRTLPTRESGQNDVSCRLFYSWAGMTINIVVSPCAQYYNGGQAVRLDACTVILVGYGIVLTYRTYR
jgi:hypothetical protein